MKKLWCILVLLLVLTGCSGQKTMETVTDVIEAPAMAQMGQISLTLPKDTTVATMENGNDGTLYLCDRYCVTVQTLPGGNLGKTLQSVTGFSKEQLVLMEREDGNVKRYDCVWSAVGEEGDVVARGTVLDDGAYHYVVTVMAPFQIAGDLAQTWQNILESVSLSTD